MISKRMAKGINKQINEELYSSYLYLSMAASADDMGLKGAAHWLKVQAKEEQGHAMRFYDYLNSQGEKVTLEAIAKPDGEFKSLLQMFTETLKHEKKITALINGLASLAADEKDYATGVALQWFVSEQVEEESVAVDMIGKLKLAGDHGATILMVDQILGKREG